MADTSPQQLASGPKHGNLFSLSWPIFIDLTMHFFTIIINTAMVSMLSLQAVAEMNLGGQAFQFAFTLFNFVNIGVCVCFHLIQLCKHRCLRLLCSGNRQGQ